MSGPSGKQALNAPIRKGSLNGKQLGRLHLDIVSFGEVKATIGRFLAVGPCMKQGQHLPARIHG